MPDSPIEVVPEQCDRDAAAPIFRAYGAENYAALCEKGLPYCDKLLIVQTLARHRESALRSQSAPMPDDGLVELKEIWGEMKHLITGVCSDVECALDLGDGIDALSSDGVVEARAAVERVDQLLSALRAAPEREAIEDIAAERQRQIDKEGWTPEHDDHHTDGSLAKAACCYAVGDKIFAYSTDPNREVEPFWTWHMDWWKPTFRRRELIKAGALIVAEIERLDRAERGDHLPKKEPGL